jgi:hypothetical protein
MLLSLRTVWIFTLLRLLGSLSAVGKRLAGAGASGGNPLTV